MEESEEGQVPQTAWQEKAQIWAGACNRWALQGDHSGLPALL